MDVSEIAERTGIAVRQLRYAIYHTLVPGVRRVEKGRGAARRFTDFEAFGIALVAMLLESGLKREVVSDCMELLVGGYSHQVTTGDIPLWCAFVGGGTTKVEVADRRFVRLTLSGAPGENPLDTGWKAVGGKAAANKYEPLVILSVNITLLRNALRARGH